MSRRKIKEQFGAVVLAVLLLIFHNQFISFLSKASDIIGKIIGNIILKSLGI